MSRPSRLPDVAGAVVPDRKLREYLLSTAHPVGGAKARYLISRGYRVSAPDVLKRDLLKIARTGSVRSTEQTVWGTKHLVVGTITAPDGATMTLATVWILGQEGHPVLVTAYPAGEKA